MTSTTLMIFHCSFISPALHTETSDPVVRQETVLSFASRWGGVAPGHGRRQPCTRCHGEEKLK